MLFSCPKCGLPLAELEGRRACERGHSYDRARGGYYNLLLSSSGGTHGDNREMVLARRAFLGAGYYAPLANAVAEAALAHTPRQGTVLDAGCGEGYYTDTVERALYERDGGTRVAGFDISKDAIKVAAAKNPRLELAVAGSYHMPVPDASVDTVINVFSPLAIDETRRVLRDGGHFIMAIPDEEHLYELKAAIYDTPYKNTVADTHLDGFELALDRRITYQMHLPTPEAVAALFGMTPYAYRTGPRNAARVSALTSLDCTADFRLLVYRKGGGVSQKTSTKEQKI